MSKRKNRYKEMERNVTIALAVDAALFISYLIAAGMGIIWLKILSALAAILFSGLLLVILYLSNELLRQRSLWMSCAAAAILICTLLSLLLGFPSPNPYK